MRTRYQGPSAFADSERSVRIAAEETEAARNSAPGRKWTVEQRKFFRSWRNYYPSLAYAREDPGNPLCGYRPLLQGFVYGGPMVYLFNSRPCFGQTGGRGEGQIGRIVASICPAAGTRTRQS